MKLRILQLGVFAALLVAWHFFAADDGKTIIPSPVSCLAAFRESVLDGTLWSASSASLQRVIVGFTFALLGGLAVGIAIALLPPLRIVLTPFFEILRPIPPIAWIPLAVALLGIGNASAYLIIFVGAFFPVLTNVVLGMSTVEKSYLDVARVFGASRWRSFVHVILPSSLPSIFAGVRVGMGFAWMCVVAAEMFAARSGLGYEIQLNRQLFRLDRVVAAMVVIGLIGFTMSRLMVLLEWAFLPWRREFLALEVWNQAPSLKQIPKTRNSETFAYHAAVAVGEKDPPPTPRTDGANIDIKALTFAYGDGPTVLRDINLDVKRGEIFCILGESGCGKSTLLKLLAGLENQFEGSIAINGDPPMAVRADITMAFQNASLFPWKTAVANIRFALNSREGRTDNVSAASETALSLVRLKHKADAYPHQLSGGQLQRVAMARAIACNPRLVLLDEPLSALDNSTRETLQGEMSALLTRSGITAIMVTHDISEAIFMADRIAIMSPQDGHLVRVFEVLCPRPRPDVFRATDEFNSLHARIWAEMRSTGSTPDLHN